VQQQQQQQRRQQQPWRQRVDAAVAGEQERLARLLEPGSHTVKE
jgi:hypothetical protein